MKSRANTGSHGDGYLMGVFDVFHIGHLRVLQAASEACGYLTVGVASDEFAEEMNGYPPIIPSLERMGVLSSLRTVDNVVLQSDPDVLPLWRDLRFQVLILTASQAVDAAFQQGADQLRAEGVEVLVLPDVPSTGSRLLLEAHLDGVV